jgi:hypothetical protein
MRKPVLSSGGGDWEGTGGEGGSTLRWTALAARFATLSRWVPVGLLPRRFLFRMVDDEEDEIVIRMRL